MTVDIVIKAKMPKLGNKQRRFPFFCFAVSRRPRILPNNGYTIQQENIERKRERLPDKERAASFSPCRQLPQHANPFQHAPQVCQQTLDVPLGVFP